VRREEYVAALDAGVDDERLVAWLAERGRRTIYAPDTSVVAAPLPVFRPHLRSTIRHARARGAAARMSHGGSLSSATLLSLAPVGCAVAGILLILATKGAARGVGVALIALYGVLVGASAGLGAARFRSLRVGLLAVPALVATQAAYIGGFVHGLARGR